MNTLEAVVPIINHRLVLEDSGLPLHAEQARVNVQWDDHQALDRRSPPPALKGLGTEKGDIWFASSERKWTNANLTNGDLPEHAATRMRAVFATHPSIEQVILFGSRAQGNHKRTSDIDLALTGPIDFSELGTISWELDDLLLPWEIDLLHFDRITNQDLREHIARVGHVFYSKLEMAA
jgi:predicted nucleotidyltransferase